MILFLNFAPIEFMGGAEKWMAEMAGVTSDLEDTLIIDVHASLANFYGQLVLGRIFNNNLGKNTLDTVPKRQSLSFKHFIPFSHDWKKIQHIIQNSRVIYARYELMELFLLMYFGGFSIFSKTVAGLHLSIVYEDPKGIFQHIHNIIYGSFIYKYVLSKSKLVHVINKRDENFLKEKFKLTNVSYCPNGTKIPSAKQYKLDASVLNIIFVGEISIRKGIDTILDVIKESPDNYHFYIVGDGPMKNELLELKKTHANIHYLGYLSSEELYDSYSRSDVLLFPSRAEAFGLVMIEAMASGLYIVNSKEVSLQLDKNMEYTAQSRNAEEYLQFLSTILSKKVSEKNERKKIREFCISNFSSDVINKKFAKEILSIN